MVYTFFYDSSACVSVWWQYFQCLFRMCSFGSSLFFYGIMRLSTRPDVIPGRKRATKEQTCLWQTGSLFRSCVHASSEHSRLQRLRL